MNRFLGAGLLALLSGCMPPTSESVTQKYTALLNKVSDRLDTVQASTDADQAATDILTLLKESDSIVQSARQVDSQAAVSDAVKQAAKDSSQRVAAAVRRVREAGHMTPALSDAVNQIQYSFEAVASALETGRLAPAETPLEQAWVDLIATYDEQAELLGALTDEASAAQAIDKLVAIERRRHAALTRIAEQGGESPPAGVPGKYREHYDAAQARMLAQDGNITSAIGQDAAKRLNQELQQTLAADPALRTNPFANRPPPTPGGPPGPPPGPPGHLAPPPPPGHFGPPGGGNQAGRPPLPPAVGPPGPSDRAPWVEQQIAGFFDRNGGPQNCVTLVVRGMPRQNTPEGNQLVARAKELAGARATGDFAQTGKRFVLLAPVNDVAAFAAKIDFGTVASIDAEKREITIDVDSPASP